MKKLFVLATIASLTFSTAFGVDQEIPFEAPQSPTLTFALPEDKTQWQEVTLTFFNPILTSPTVKEKLQELLNFTMPSTGDFDPIDVERRAKTIIFTYKMLAAKNEAEQLKLLTKLTERHHQYITQNK